MKVKVFKSTRKALSAVFMTVSGRSMLMVLIGLFFCFFAADIYAEAAAAGDPLGQIGTVATDTLTLIFNSIGAVLVLVGLLMFIGAAINIARGRSTAGELFLMFVVAAALFLIGIAFVALGLTEVGKIGG